jgi:hypothetical protein
MGAVKSGGKDYGAEDAKEWFPVAAKPRSSSR